MVMPECFLGGCDVGGVSGGWWWPGFGSWGVTLVSGV